MRTNTWLAAFVGLAVLPTASSCAQLECGEGTIERNGECVVSDGMSPEVPACGDYQHWDPVTEECTPDVVCDPATSEPEVNENGEIVCKGTGVVGCSLNCPSPASGKISLCGSLYDVETDAAIAEGGTGTQCDPDNPTATGPCSLEINFYSALPFAMNPTGTPPLGYGRLTVNDCGNFAAIDIDEPQLGYVGIGIDDSPNGTSDNYTLAGVALPAAAGLRRNDLVSYAVLKSTDTKWTNSSGISGDSFGVRGAYVPIFLHGDGAPDSSMPADPVAGVTVTENGAAEPANTYYFTDTDPHTRATLNSTPGGTTTVNGSAVKINSSLVNHSGTGSEPVGCNWPVDLAAAITGVVFVQRRIAEDTNGDTCP